MAGSCFKSIWGDKAQKSICNCKKRCDSWFPENIQLREGCYAACEPHSSNMQTKESYLCTSIGPTRDSVILAYGYDPCGGGNQQYLKETLDPFKTNQTASEKKEGQSGSNTIILAVVLLVVLLLISLLKR